MNFISRLLRLPLVIKNPVLGVTSIALLGGIQLAGKIYRPAPVPNQVPLGHNILSLAKWIMDKWLETIPSNENRWLYIIKTAHSGISHVAQAVFTSPKKGPVDVNELPSFITTRLKVKDIIGGRDNLPGAKVERIVIAIDPFYVNLFGFFLLIARTALICYVSWKLYTYLSERAVKWIESKQENNKQEAKVIDVKKREIRPSSSKPLFLRDYIDNK